ncbi:MAG: hypothetical protein HY331_06340 [Chloroflexi bacterium]|nr:hypothetical protein [Chloroflexota bacterium]
MAELHRWRVVPYVNQFFAGIGGQELAGVGPRAIDEARCNRSTAFAEVNRLGAGRLRAQDC